MPQDTSRVTFGITGSISAYKALDIIRQLRQSSVSVQPILSTSAHRFVTPWSVETLSESTVISNEVSDGQITHLHARDSDVFVVCPASANAISKLAHGHCQDLLSASFLSYTGRRLICPAMHTEMFQNTITQTNLSILKSNGAIIVPPDPGPLACGDYGLGRLPDPTLLSQLIRALLIDALPLNGCHITITCGGTSEPIDPVRHITNRSSGLLGHAIANIAAIFGAKVTLIRSVVHPTLSSVDCLTVETCQDMHREVLKDRPCDALIMAAAVSDFTVIPKSKKQRRGYIQDLQLKSTPDILSDFNRKAPKDCVSIGFCLSDDDNIHQTATEKMKQKNCHGIVANAPNSFGQHRRTFHLISPDTTQSFSDYPLEKMAIELLKFYLSLKKKCL